MTISADSARTKFRLLLLGGGSHLRPRVGAPSTVLVRYPRSVRDAAGVKGGPSVRCPDGEL